jgi:hypothetical protein
MPSRDLYLPEVPPMMSSKDYAEAQTVDARTAVAIIEGFFDGDGFPPDGRGAMIVDLPGDRTVGITIEDVSP